MSTMMIDNAGQDGVTRAAIMSSCRRFRYMLSRRWNEALPALMFVMLNPSTADAHVDDPTIVKCIGFAKRMGYGGIEVFNLFAYRATDPADLRRAGYPVGPENDALFGQHLREYFETSMHLGTFKDVRVVCAWGANARVEEARSRAQDVIDRIRRVGAVPVALKLLDDGVPSHPLMLPYTCATELMSMLDMTSDL